MCVRAYWTWSLMLKHQCKNLAKSSSPIPFRCISTFEMRPAHFTLEMDILPIVDRLADCRHLLGSFPFRGYSFSTRHKTFIMPHRYKISETNWICIGNCILFAFQMILMMSIEMAKTMSFVLVQYRLVTWNEVKCNGSQLENIERHLNFHTNSIQQTNSSVWKAEGEKNAWWIHSLIRCYKSILKINSISFRSVGVRETVFFSLFVQYWIDFIKYSHLFLNPFLPSESNINFSESRYPKSRHQKNQIKTNREFLFDEV